MKCDESYRSELWEWHCHYGARFKVSDSKRVRNVCGTHKNMLVRKGWQVVVQPTIHQQITQKLDQIEALLADIRRLRSEVGSDPV